MTRPPGRLPSNPDRKRVSVVITPEADAMLVEMQKLIEERTGFPVRKTHLVTKIVAQAYDSLKDEARKT
jgi:hypothetical protein